MIKENEQPCTTETTQLTPARIELGSAALGLGLMLSGAVIGASTFGSAMFLAGYTASTLYRTVQPYIDARGSYAVFAICFAIPLLLVWRGNHKIAGTWPNDWL